MLLCLLIFLWGVFVGFLIGSFNGDDQPLVGNLRIDRSDGMPYLFLELYEGTETVAKHEWVTLRVIERDYISTQK